MLKSGASVAVIATVLGLSAALEQTNQPPPAATPAPKAPVAGQMMTQPADTFLTRDIVGQTVYQPDDTKIGTISDLLLSKDAKSVQGFVIGVGGFLGIGERSVALQMDKLKMTSDADGRVKLVMDMKREDLANAPAFKSLREIEAEKKAAERPASTPPGQRPPVQR
jgi:sporulation protein YlmC with PRC-barrel domain